MKKRILSLLLAVVMIVGMLPAFALAEGTEPEPQSDVKYGSYVEGEWTENGNGSSASTTDGSNITVKKEAVKTDDNTYKITLTVEMKQTASTVAAPAATVLVIDCSGSMKYCAECGNGQRYTNNCEYRTYGDGIQTNQTRLYAAKEAAYSFLDAYKGNASGIDRWVAVVGFGSGLKNLLNINWYDVSTDAGYNAVKTAISDLDAGGGTNLDAGLRKADDLLKDKRFDAKTVKNVIALTDGKPTYYVDGNGTGGNGNDCTEDVFIKTKASAAALKKNATLYTVCFGASRDKIYDYSQSKTEFYPGYGWYYPQITVGNYLKNHISSGMGYAFDADNTEELNNAFKNITQTIVEGIVAGTVTDSLPAAVSTTDPNFATSWELTPEDATSVRVDVNDGSKTYIYEKTYTVTIDPEQVAEGTDYQPLNNETYLVYGENKRIDFPIPAGKVTRPTPYSFNLNGYIVKSLEGELDEAGTFTVKVQNGNTTVATGTATLTTGSEAFDFGNTTIELSETTIFTVIEDTDNAISHVTYDDTAYQLRVSVKLNKTENKWELDKVEYYDADREIWREIGSGDHDDKLVITNSYAEPTCTASKSVVTLTDTSVPDTIAEALRKKGITVDLPKKVGDTTQLIVDKSVDKVTLLYKVTVTGTKDAEATVSDAGAIYIDAGIMPSGRADLVLNGNDVKITFRKDATVTLYYTKTFTRGTDGKFAKAKNIAVVNGENVPSEETTITDKTPGRLNFSDIILKDLYVTGDESFPESLTFEAKLTLREFRNDSGVMPQDMSSANDSTVQDERYTVIEAFPQGWYETLYATFNPDDVTFDAHNTTRFTAKDGSSLVLTFPAAGRYTFRVEEINGNADGVTYDSHVYEIVVYVFADGDGLYVGQITLFKITDGDKQVALGENVETITFYNEVDTGEIPYYPIIPTIVGKDTGKLNKTDHFAYIIGYPDGTVHPNGEITRAEVATIFFRLLKDDVRNAYFTSYNTYSDVQLGKWYNNPISTMSALGIINGYPDGTFRPNAPITRAEFAAIAARFDETATRGTTTFTDVYGHWAADEIAKAYGNDWIKGYPDGTFRPDRNITRAEAMALINRVLDRGPESPSDLLPDMNKWSDNMDTTKWYYLDIQEATNSHDYTRKTFNYELWKRMLLDPDWSRYER